MISVVMATFNSSKYIVQQLNSIIQNNDQIDEMIIVDDCSNDNTVSIIQNIISKYHLDKWRVYENKSNLGYRKTFRKAISKTHGDIIVLCDHDDIWIKNKISIIRNAFKENDNILYLATKYIQIDGNGDLVKVKLKKNRANNNLIKHSVTPHDLVKLNFKDIAVYNIAPGCTCAFSRKILPDFLTFQDKILPHDWALATIAAVKQGLYYLDIPTTKYRIYDGNTIGLVHQSIYRKRLTLCQRNLTEKKEMLLLAKELDASKKDIEYLQRVVDLFDIRYKNLSDRNILFDIILVFQSYGVSTLYESILMDIVSILKIKGK
ncbi:glycosyltransferase [Limosilactobacillus reuteri]|uniref:glycosyltransferase n=1 Tax=Limosilactobacillus reuteri TaxID=1598 RepID=UPI001E4D7F9C|nr:glycosyltransferase [Limosilactobacillus reuteri]MCC4396417.1 glycosyltransferase [Limosilactobacillus reuteri]MCC4402374.1 glycosyltransferase [Limosilactobacillus reuteri]